MRQPAPVALQPTPGHHRRNLCADLQAAAKAAHGNRDAEIFDWSYRAGAKLADELQYVPMPNDVAQMIESAWAEVTDAHGQPAWTEPTTAKH